MKLKIRRIIIVLLVILVVLLAIYTYYVSNKHEDEHPVMGPNFSEEELKQLHFKNLEGLNIFSTNKTEQIKIARKFETLFKETIPNIQKELKDSSDEEIENYYDTNEVENVFAYPISKEDFVKLIKEVNTFNIDLENDYVTCSFEEKEDKLGVYVSCSYINEETIDFLLNIDKTLQYVE